MTTETKPSNPKDVIGSKKLPVGLVPDTIVAEVALAYLEGALKYGRANWRIAGVSASIYNDALERHRMKWWNGENADRTTRVKHLASVIACAGILLDAELCGQLTDDRPPSVPMSDLIDSADERVAYLKELFKDHNPKQYTIADTIKPLHKDDRLKLNAPNPLILGNAGTPTATEVHVQAGRSLRPDTVPQAYSDANLPPLPPPIF